VKKVAVICNSTNPDLLMYFSKKSTFLKNKAEFFGNRSFSKKLKVKTSSFSSVSGFSWKFFVDCIWSCLVFIQLLFMRTRVVLFDTAHISNLPLAVLCKMARIKLVFTIHDWNPHEGEQQGAVSAYNKFVKTILADEFVVFSDVESNKRVYKLRLSGFDKEKGGEPQDYFLFFGRIEPYKGLKHLLMIAKEMLSRKMDFRVIIAGKGDDPAMGELKKLPNVEIINRFIQDEELDSLLKGAVATLLPYDSATQSGVILHSYSYQVPVVSFDVGKLSEYITPGFGGHLVEHSNITAFVDAMADMVLKSHEYREKVASEFKKYDDSALREQYESLLSDIAK